MILYKTPPVTLQWLCSHISDAIMFNRNEAWTFPVKSWLWEVGLSILNCAGDDPMITYSVLVKDKIQYIMKGITPGTEALKMTAAHLKQSVLKNSQWKKIILSIKKA